MATTEFGAMGLYELTEAQAQTMSLKEALWPPMDDPGGGGLGSASIPVEFDARKQWPSCTSLNSPTNQGSCGARYRPSAWVCVVTEPTDRAAFPVWAEHIPRFFWKAL